MERTFTKIVKRDGRIQNFDSSKICQAITKAGYATGEFKEETAQKLTTRVLNLASQIIKNQIPTVEEIQDVVEEVLIGSPYKKTAKSYIIYRDQHVKIREMLFRGNIDLVDAYLNKIDWRVKENSNMTFSLQGLNNYISSEISKIYWLNKIYPPEVKLAHIEGDFHIHDLGIISVYCVGWDLQDLLLKGFRGVPSKIESRPSKHFQVALGQIVNFFYSLQGEAAGAQAFSNFDTLLSPFIYYDRLSYKEVKQAIQEFLFNMNVPTRVGFQCLSEDTEILTEKGWSKYTDINVGSVIATLNLETESIEYQTVEQMFCRPYEGVMYHIKNRDTDQLISPKHRVVRRLFAGSEKLVLEEIEKVIEYSSGIRLPKFAKGIDRENSDIYVSRKDINAIHYKGIIWCPTTKNSTVIARRNGKVFITGNSPFTNVTLDLNVPSYLADQPVIIGGKLQNKTYKEFQKEIDMFNQAFFEVMLEGDAKGRVFTFPIPTYNITSNFDWNNKNSNLLWEITAKYGIPYFANFVNSDMNPEDVRSMCPIAGDEKVLIKSREGKRLKYSSIKNIYEGNLTKDNYEIYSDGKFVRGEFNKFENQKMIKVILENGHELKMTNLHLNFVMLNKESGIKVLKGEELKKGMYLPYSLKVYKGKGGNRDLGYFVGAFAGDGSFDGDTSVIFSLNNEKKKKVANKLIQIAVDYFGANYSTKQSEKTKLFTLRIHSKAAVGLCKDFVSGKGKDKYYTAKVFNKSLEFRKGVIEGHYATDGGNRNRIYTSSKKMVETLNMLAATLGTTTSIYIDNRKGRLGTEPNYAVLIYQLNRTSYGDFWFKYDNKLWVKIKSIEPLCNTTAYCFEVENDEPMFTVGTTGILTHNCRLRIDNRKLEKRGGGLFGASPLTGSIGVITINMPRIGFLAKNEEDFFNRLERLMILAKESLEIKRKVLEKLTENNLYPYTKFYLRNIKKRFNSYWKNHFSTIGIVGMNEACLNFLNKNIGTEKGRKFTIKVLNFMRDKLMEFQKETGNNYNLEASPAESCVAGETLVKTVEYGDKQIKDLVGKTFGVWSFDKDKGICIKRAYNVRKTRINAKVIEIELDKGKSIVLTPDHRIAVNRPNRWGLDTIKWVRAEDLKQNDSIKSLYFSKSKGYIMVNSKQKRANILYEWYYKDTLAKGDVVHHKNGIKEDDSKKNLEKMNEKEHKKLHFKNNNPSIVNPKYGEKNSFYGKHHSKKTKKQISEKKKGKPFILKNITKSKFSEIMSNVTKNKAKEKHSRYRKDIITSDIVKMYEKGCTYKEIANCFNCTQGLVQSRLKEVNLNHKVKKIKKISKRIDVYNLEVEDTENYFIDDGNGNGILIHNCTYRLAKKDKSKFPEIKCANEEEYKRGAESFYTNSSHLPVNFTDDIFELLDSQDEIQTLYTGGTVVHIFLGEQIKNYRVIRELVKKVCQNYRLPYFTITPTFSICPNCGYISGEHYTCPKCNEACEVYSRVVGYLRPVNQWNKGKQEEFKNRKEFKV